MLSFAGVTVLYWLLFKDRDTGGPGGPWPPQKISVEIALGLHSFISISDYQIGTPLPYVYLWRYVQAIKLVLHQSHAYIQNRFTCNINLYRGTKISFVVSQFEEPGIKFFQGSTPKPLSRF